MVRRAARVLPALVLGCLATLVVVAGPVGAERVQRGNLIVSINGGISPRTLPRRQRVPVSVYLEGGVMTSDGSPVPRVNWIRLELGWRGELGRRGLFVCPRGRLASTTSRLAATACSRALVGRGWLYAKIFVPGQAPFGIRAHLLAFNGKTRAGRAAVLVHAYARDPPISFVLPFVVRHKTGSFRTALVSTIRKSVGPWPHVSKFRIKVGRIFRIHGRRVSYLNASCPVPNEFTAGFASFARATYMFAGGRKMTKEAVRSCRAR